MVVPILSRMYSDAVNTRQPENTHNYALNQVMRNYVLTTEDGFSVSLELPANTILISSYYLNSNKVILFLKNEKSIIAIYDGTNIKEYVSAELNFDPNYFIDCTYRLRNGCEDVIYFTDNLNPIRYFNFSRINDFKTDNEWDINKFSLAKNWQVPSISNIKVINSTGKIKTGSVIFAIDYVDEGLNRTPIVATSNPVLIYKGNEFNLSGTIDEYVYKSVEFSVTNLDPTFKFYRVYIGYINGLTGEIVEAKRSTYLPVTNSKFVFNNLQDLDTVPISDLYEFKSPINRALAIEQLDDALLLGNVRSEKLDVVEHQNLASKVGVLGYVKQVDKNAVESSYHPNNPNYLEFASHMADEVIALAITYVNSKTGQEAGPYHIPGRPIDSDPVSCLKVVSGNKTIIKCVRFLFDTKSSPQAGDIRIIYTIKNNGVSTVKRWDVSIYDQEPNRVVFDLCLEAGDEFSLNSIINRYTENVLDPNTYALEYFTKTIENSGTYETILKGWDSTLSTFISADHEAFGIKSVEILMPYYFEFYNNGEPLQYDDAKFKRVEFITFLENKVKSGELNFPLRWELYNTATYNENGNLLLGYHENKYSFYEEPINSDCKDKDYWGVDICGSSLKNTRVRHHRLPDRRLIPITTDNNINLLGLEFFNIEYPKGYDSHYFSCGVKTENDKTVIDTGITSRQTSNEIEQVKGSAYLYNQYSVGDQSVTGDVAFYSPKVLAGEHQPSGYLKVYYNYNNLGPNVEKPRFTQTAYYYFSEVARWSGADDLQVVVAKYTLERSTTIPRITNYPIDAAITVNPLQSEFYRNREQYTIKNLSNANKLHYLVKDRHEQGVYNSYASIKINKDVYNNLDYIQYRRLHNSLLTKESSQKILGGDTFITKFNIVNYALAHFEADESGPAITAFVVALNAALAVLTAGASLALTATLGGVMLASGITKSVYENTLLEAKNNIYRYLRIHSLNLLFDEPDILGDGLFGYIMEVLEDVYIDSYVNWELRVDPNVDELRVLRDSTILNVRNAGPMFTYVKNKFVSAPENGEKAGVEGLIMRPLITPEYYGLNPDYNPTLYIKSTYPIPRTYNICSDCLEEFSSRLYYSLQSYQEEVVDNYRVILPNNYKDVIGEFGPIVDLVKHNNSLYISTKEALLEQPRNYQERVTDQLVSFIGTGSLLELPVRQVMSNEGGAIGNVNRQSTLNTSDGMLFIDVYNLKIYLVRDKEIKNLAGESYGNKEWLEKNLPIQLTKYFNIDTLHSSNICGYIVVYDEIDKRILITKKDYTPKLKNIQFDGGFYVATKQQSTPISLEDDRYFYDNSFTISFSLLYDSFVSFHSYVPDLYIYFKNNLFATKENKIYEFRNKLTRALFFDKKYPCIIEFTFNNKGIENIYNSILLSTQALRYNQESDTYIAVPNVTYNQLLAYNERQASGFIELYDPTDINVKRLYSNNIVHLFRDMVDNDEPIFIENFSVDNKITNKTFNEKCINTEKEWYRQHYFKSKYLVIRLIFNTFDDVKLNTEFSLINQQTSK